MKVDRITADNLDDSMGNIIHLGNEFLDFLNVERSRDDIEDRKVVQLMIHAPQTEIFLGYSKDSPIGLSYFNMGTGFSCGGNYIWINCLYITQEHRGRGFGSQLLESIETYGDTIDARLDMSTRDTDNMRSKEVFSKLRYNEELQPMITKPGQSGRSRV